MPSYDWCDIALPLQVAKLEESLAAAQQRSVELGDTAKAAWAESSKATQRVHELRSAVSQQSSKMDQLSTLHATVTASLAEDLVGLEARCGSESALAQSLGAAVDRLALDAARAQQSNAALRDENQELVLANRAMEDQHDTLERCADVLEQDLQAQQQKRKADHVQFRDTLCAARQEIEGAQATQEVRGAWVGDVLACCFVFCTACSLQGNVLLC